MFVLGNDIDTIKTVLYKYCDNIFIQHDKGKKIYKR